MSRLPLSGAFVLCLGLATAVPVAAEGPLTDPAPAFAGPRVPVVTTWESSTGSIATADVTGDGVVDTIATTTTHFDDDHDRRLWVFNGTASPDGYSEPATPYLVNLTYENPGDMVLGVGDFDADARNDVVVGHTHGLDVFLQQPDGTLRRSVTLPASDVNDLEVADMDGDGRADILSNDSPRLRLWHSKAAGFRLAPAQSDFAAPGTTEIEVVDVNRDGRPDVIAQTVVAAQPAVGVFLQRADHSFFVGQRVPVGDTLIHGFGVGDVNGDGWSDVVAGTHHPDFGVSTLQILRNDGRGRLTSPEPRTVLDNGNLIEVDDMTGDGLDDVVVMHVGWGSVGILVQLADHSLGSEHLYDASPIRGHDHHQKSLALGDVTGDGLRDISLANAVEGIRFLGSLSAPPAVDTRLIDRPRAAVPWGSPATFVFSGTHAGSALECSVDGAPYSRCTSPHRTSRLAPRLGHTFAARAVSGGHIDSSPVTATFRSAAADLAVGFGAVSADPVVGRKAAVRVRLSNLGNTRARKVRLSLRAPSGLHPSDLASGCALARDPRRVICRVGTVLPGELHVRTFRFRVRASATYRLLAIASSSSPDLRPGNNARRVTLTTGR